MEEIKHGVGPVIIVFGITGDLSKRKLLPALYHLLSEGDLPTDTKIIGVSRRELSAEQLLDTVELCVLDKDNVCDPVGLQRVKQSLQTIKVDPENPADFVALQQLVDSFPHADKRQRLIYLSIPTSAYPPLLSNLAESGFNNPQTRLLIEKPFGRDITSAQSLIDLLNQDFNEKQIYRIDHYLAKETAQNLITFRLHNPIFDTLWNQDHIKRVTVRAYEQIGIEGRGNFYEQTGALRDLIQSHLMQLLAITMMDLPGESMESDAIHLSKEHFLEQLLPADPVKAARAQYDGYREEAGNPTSTIETFARLQLTHSAERWQDTEIMLETGKGLHKKTTDITIEFKTPHERRRNNLVFQIQPDEGIGLDLIVKEPGLENRTGHAKLDFRYSDTFKDTPNVDAYERVLMDALRGDQALFASDREVLATWNVLQPVLDAWQDNDHNLHRYKLGVADPLA